MPSENEPCCWRCTPEWQGMMLCATCGNKRCPHATDHDLVCTNSNDLGQPGSIYRLSKKGPPPKAQETAERCKDCEWEGCRAALVTPRKTEERLACYERTIARLRAKVFELEGETLTLTSERDTARMGQDEWKAEALRLSAGRGK